MHGDRRGRQMIGMLGAVACIALLTGCAPKSKAYSHFAQRVEHTHITNWNEQGGDFWTTCPHDEAAATGMCPAGARTVFNPQPGWADKTYTLLGNVATYAIPALILSDGLRHQAVGTNSYSSSFHDGTNSTVTTVNPSTTVNVRGSHHGR